MMDVLLVQECHDVIQRAVEYTFLMSLGAMVAGFLTGVVFVTVVIAATQYRQTKGD